MISRKIISIIVASKFGEKLSFNPYVLGKHTLKKRVMMMMMMI